MSNTVTITPTIFTSARSGHITYGYRMYDDYESSYCNLWDSIPDDDLEVLSMVIEDGIDNKVASMLSYVEEYEKGICIDEEWYDWDEIKHLFTKEE